MDKNTNIVIYETTEYHKFKKLEGNRVIKDARVDKIIESINKVGYITSPILVNEKMEVIDGQGRLAALERLRLPVQYIIREGIGIEECRNMNIHQKNWTIYDYICSFAIRGDDNYQRLQSLIDLHEIPEGVVIEVASGNIPNVGGSGNTRTIKAGRFKLTPKMYENSKWVLAYMTNFKSVAKNIGGTKKPFYMALCFAYRNLDIEQRNKLETVIRQRSIELPALNNVVDYLKYFDAFYNHGIRKNKIHLAHQFEIATE